MVSPRLTEHGIRGAHGIVVSVRDVENSEEFMESGWNGRRQRRVGGRYLRVALRRIAPGRLMLMYRLTECG